MMRSPKSFAVAVRRPDGTIALREDDWRSISERVALLRLPLIRGSVILFESIVNGIVALSFAAEQSEGMDPTQSTADQKNTGSLILAFAIAMGLFVGLPHALAWGASHLAGISVEQFGFHAFDGVFKLAIFIGYLSAISLIPEIRRIFEYHGAEHKVVNAYEQGLTVDLPTAREQPTFHARCGTSFILLVLVFSIFFFAAVVPWIPIVTDIAVLQHLALVVVKIPLMLPLAGLTYELNRWASKNPDNGFARVMATPGRWMQKLTVKEPSDDMLEVSLCAMKAALAREARAVDAAVVKKQITIFDDYATAREALAS